MYNYYSGNIKISVYRPTLLHCTTLKKISLVHILNFIGQTLLIEFVTYNSKLYVHAFERTVQKSLVS